MQQGAILSPMLFNIYVMLLGAIIRGFGVRCHHYADDIQLYFSVTSDSGEAVQDLDQHIGGLDEDP